MKALYLDCASGISGNMFLGACIQLGVPEKYLRGELEKLNLKDPVYERSAAFGYAFRHEADDNDFNNIYLLADERMYKNKTDMKSKRA